eukprot:6589999-Alexandrium_andersonii.AAC.1
MVRLVQGIEDHEGLETALASIEAAKKLQDILVPVHNTVMAAKQQKAVMLLSECKLGHMVKPRRSWELDPGCLGD